MSNSNQGGLTGLLSNVEHSGEGDEVSVGEMLAAAGPQSYGPLLLLPAAVADIPVIGAIPGVSIVVAVIIVFVAAQLLFALPHPWLPSLVLRLDVSRDKLGAATKRARPWAERLERVLAPRLTFLFEGPFKA
ncbi:MAG TPA: exopolysaccharide biosynthesis protein, partial [Hyphomicrobiales bacterium]|nr:exopolysaccharide biosynthesis protein [Hyphomicrobiales bacterium]